MKTQDNEPTIRVLKSGNCPSLSGKSKLTYEVGCGSASDLHIRVSKNTGTGYFSKDWVSWDQLQRLLEKNAKKPITSYTFSPLFRGKSVNTAGFLLAALKSEGLVRGVEENRRCYELLDGTAFLAEIRALMDAPASGPKKARADGATPAKKATSKPRLAKR